MNDRARVRAEPVGPHPTPTLDPHAYLARVLDVIEQHSVMRNHVTWPALRRDAFARAAHAATTEDTYPTIRTAVALLGDRHSLFLDPDQVRDWHAASRSGPGMMVKHPEGIVVRLYRGGAAERAGLQIGDRIESINGEHLTSLDTDQQQALMKVPRLELVICRAAEAVPLPVSLASVPYSPHLLPEGRQLADDIALLDLPAYVGHGSSGEARMTLDRKYAAAAQRIIGELEERGVRGWVVDLRRNTGGNMLPMLLGIGPLIGEGECLAFVYPNHRIGVAHEQGAILIEWEDVLRIDHPYRPGRRPPVVAVLISPLTASSGELTALAFRGLLTARSFGEPSAGVPTDNESFDLPDGARLLLTAALGADRTGQTYDDSLIPDHRVPIDWTALHTDRDPVLQAATTWIREHRLHGAPHEQPSERSTLSPH